MIKRLSPVLLFSLAPTLVFATPDYELINFSSSRIRTVDEIIQETGVTTEALMQFSCKNPNREELFANTTIQNMAKDSLKIIGVNKKLYTYIDGKFYNQEGKLLTKLRDKFLKIAKKTLARLETIPVARRLIEELEFSPYPFYIKLGGSRYLPNNPGERSNLHGNDAGFIAMMDDLRPMVEGMPFSQIGYGGFISWNPKIKAKFMEADYKKRYVDPDLVLAHEMYHAYDGMRGLLDRRFVKSDELEFQPVCEYRAVRMENALRKAFGYKYRRFYSYSEGNTQDMLDQHDEPVVLPTPCLNWL